MLSLCSHNDRDVKLDLHASLNHSEWAMEVSSGKTTYFNLYREDERIMVPFQAPSVPVGPVSTCPRLRLAMSAFDKCLKHPKCRTRNTFEFPTRILDVGPYQTGEQRMPALVTGEGLSEPYVALTYV